jgi:hypothetical protein
MKHRALAGSSPVTRKNKGHDINIKKFKTNLKFVVIDTMLHTSVLVMKKSSLAILTLIDGISS